jgi:LysM repeat protein
VGFFSDMTARRLFVYLLLNAVVSATATLGVLWLWDRAQPDRQGPVRVVEGSDAAATAPPELEVAEVVFEPEPTAPPGPAATPTLYTVKAGDTLGRIAADFEVSVEEIMAANNIADRNVLHVGQVLVIPVAGYEPPTAEPATPGPLPTNPAEPPWPTATRDPNAAAPKLEVREVLSPGSLSGEALVIVNTGGPVDLQDWTLRDGTGLQYDFPSLVLFEGGAISVHTAAGTDTVTDLYWGQSTAVWTSGKTVLLSDAGGTLHARMTVP